MPGFHAIRIPARVPTRLSRADASAIVHCVRRTRPYDGPMAAVHAILGGLIVLGVLGEAFESLVFPRRVTRRLRLSRLYYKSLWRAWTATADLIPPGRRRETLLSVF